MWAGEVDVAGEMVDVVMGVTGIAATGVDVMWRRGTEMQRQKWQVGLTGVESRWRKQKRERK